MVTSKGQQSADADRAEPPVRPDLPGGSADAFRMPEGESPSTLERTSATEQATGGARRACPLCSGERLVYLFESYASPVCQCSDCGLMFRNPIPPETTFQQVYSEHYFLGEDTAEGRKRVEQMKRQTARLYLERLREYSGRGTGRLLEIGCGNGELLVEAEKVGFEVAGVDVSPYAARTANERLGRECVRSGTLEEANLAPGSFDVCVLSDVIEHMADPVKTLTSVRRLLAPAGVLLLTTPSVDSWSARLLKRNWMEFKLEHLIFFGRSTIESALARSGYEQVVIQPNEKVLTPEYMSNHFERYQVPIVSRLVALGYRLLPRLARFRHVRVVASGILVMARPAARTGDRRLSIILPAYNEAATFTQVMDSLLAKDLHGLEKEIIVVESNSADGTREAAMGYRGIPGVTLVLEDMPKGKGHAVRSGLTRATGDFILIQDADLEYDFNDYDALLEPLRKFRSGFVLGIRHGGDWKMRHFIENPWQSNFMNIGHVIFTALLNLLYGQRLKDPFTMFKVFRRDCLFGLDFESDRFDFDYELVIKLLRKGYRPVEVPVNYNSRSFSQGKKVRILRDPITWVWALVKFRFVSLHRTSRRIQR